MKKIIPVAVVILLVIVGSVMWIRHSMGVTDAAELLPAQTVAFASLPDLPRTMMRWPKTTLARIGLEPEMKSFLEKPFEYLTKSRGGDQASNVIIQLKPGRIFAAAVAVSSNDAAILIGFQYWGGKIAHDAAVTRLRQEIARGGPMPEPAHENHLGDDIASTTQKGVTIYNASHGQWGFISNNLPAIKDALDRAAGRKKDDSLAANPSYRTVLSRLLKEPDFLFFLQPQSALETLLAVGKTMGAQAIPQQIEQAKKIDAIGAAVKLDGENMRDSIFILRQAPPNIGDLTHGAIKLTSKDTLAYFDFVADFRQITNVSANPALAGLLKSPAVQGSRLPQLAHEAFGPECAVSVSWNAKPEGLLAVRVKDSARAEESLQELVALFPETTISELDGVKYYSFPTLQHALASPAVTLTKDYLFLGLDAASIQQAQKSMSTGETLEKNPAFAAALPAYKAANEVFGYVDARAIFEKGFPMLRQVIVFSAALMPGVAEVIDSSKIPNTETIARHLSPIVYSQTRLPDGYLIESSGPITMNQALIIGAAAGSSFLKPPAAQ